VLSAGQVHLLKCGILATKQPNGRTKQLPVQHPAASDTAAVLIPAAGCIIHFVAAVAPAPAAAATLHACCAGSLVRLMRAQSLPDTDCNLAPPCLPPAACCTVLYCTVLYCTCTAHHRQTTTWTQMPPLKPPHLLQGHWMTSHPAQPPRHPWCRSASGSAHTPGSRD
jgi:hypothetical protein